METRFSKQIVTVISLCRTVVAAVQCGRRSVQTRIEYLLIRRGIVAVALLAVLIGTPDSAAQTFDEAVEAHERGDYATALRGFRVHAEQGNADAQYRLGKMYDELFLMYAYGDGLPKDHVEAMKWFCRAAERSHVNARYDDYLMRAYGEIVPEGLDYLEWKQKDVKFNFSEAVRWFRTVAEHELAEGEPAGRHCDNWEGQFKLGVVYDIGLDVPEDDAEAARWFLKAGAGHFYAQLITGQVWGYNKKTIKWSRRGAELGFVKAQVALASNYSSGKVVPKNGAEALKWYRKAAEQGDLGASVSLGVMYYNGEGVPKDYVRAYAWLNLAVAQGETAYAKIRDYLESIMTNDQIARAQEISSSLFSRINQSQ